MKINTKGQKIAQSEYGDQIRRNDLDVLHAPADVMDVKRWYQSLTPNQQAQYQRGLHGLSGNKSEADYMNHQK